MNNLFKLCILFCSFNLFAETTSVKIASLNLQGWIDTSSRRAILMKELFKTRGLMDGVSLMITQESIEQTPLSTTDQLAKELGWRSFSERRVSDNEGLGVLYSKKSDLEEILTLQLNAKSSPDDFSRMALTGVLNHRDLGRVRIVNVHLAHQIGKSQTRKRQLREIIDWLKELEKSSPSEVIILGGDFNTGIGDISYAGEFAILQESPYRFQIAKPTGARYTYKDMKTGNKRLIDHFFVSQKRNLQIKSMETRIYQETTELKLSDHNLIILEINVQK